MEKFLVKSSVLKLADRLDGEHEDDMLSVYVTPNSKPPEEAGDVTSETGMIIFHSSQSDLIIIPPFPVLRNEIFREKKFHTEQLREIFSRQYRLGVVLMHLGEYAVAFFHGDKITAVKCGKQYVHAKHGKGGYSQGRFSRLREVQMKHYFDAVYRNVKEVFESRIDEIEYVIYGGPRITVSAFLKRDHLMKKFSAKTLERILNVERANKTELDDVMREVWKTRVLFLKEEEK